MNSSQLSRIVIARKEQSRDTRHLREQFILPKLQAAITTKIKNWSKIYPPETAILDVGCGLQPYRKEIEKSNFRYLSFDVMEKQDLNITFIGFIDQTLPDSLLSHGPFSLILVSEVMEHVLDWNKAFENLARLLIPGGEIFLTVPFVFPLHEEPYDYWRPTHHAFETIAKKHNLVIKEALKAGNALSCLGLITGHLLEKMHYQTPENARQKLWLSLKQRFLKGLLLVLHSLIQSGFLNDNFSHCEDMYISNFVTLTKF